MTIGFKRVDLSGEFVPRVKNPLLPALNDYALQTTLPPKYEVTTPVEVKGEALSTPIYWTGRQWAVTRYGIERRDGRYHIAGDRVWEARNGHGWLEHMEEKPRVDLEDFAEALRLARGLWPKTPA